MRGAGGTPLAYTTRKSPAFVMDVIVTKQGLQSAEHPLWLEMVASCSAQIPQGAWASALTRKFI